MGRKRKSRNFRTAAATERLKSMVISFVSANGTSLPLPLHHLPLLILPLFRRHPRPQLKTLSACRRRSAHRVRPLGQESLLEQCLHPRHIPGNRLRHLRNSRSNIQNYWECWISSAAMDRRSFHSLVRNGYWSRIWMYAPEVWRG